MQLKTKIIETTSSEIFKVYLSHYFNRQWLLFALLTVLVGWNAIRISNGSSDYLPLMVLLVILGLIILNTFRVFNHKDTQRRLHPKQFEVDEGQFFVYPNKDRNNRVPISRIFRLYRKQDYYLIYFAKNHYYYLPYRFFEKGDKERFEEWLDGKFS